jgi:hypothetical protein
MPEGMNVEVAHKLSERERADGTSTAGRRPRRSHQGPVYVRNPQLEQAKRLNDEAAATLAEGTAARETADQYVPALPRL